MPQLTAPSTSAFEDDWRAEGFAWLPVTSTDLGSARDRFPKDRGIATAQRLSGIVEAFDVAWFFERHWAMPSLRARRFRDRLLPIIVLDSEPDPELLPKSMEEINRGAFEPLRFTLGGLGLQWTRDRSETKCVLRGKIVAGKIARDPCEQ